MKHARVSILGLFAGLFALALGIDIVWAAAVGRATAPTPTTLIDFSAPDAGRQVAPTKGVPTSIMTVDKTGIAMHFPIQPAPHPGVYVTPATGTAWDLSAYGHVEAKVTNLGEKNLPFVMQVEDGGGNLNNLESITVKPGESKTLKVVFGYQYGYEAGAPINPSTIRELYIFLWDTADPHSFRIEELKAAGVPGEKPDIDPNTFSQKPKNGVILGTGALFDAARQVKAHGAQVVAGPDNALAVSFAGGQEESITIRPAIGMWDLTEANQIRIKIKNTGQGAVTPGIAIDTARTVAREPLASGAETELAVSFVPAVNVTAPAPHAATGVTIESDKVKELSVLADATPGAKSLLITSIIADAAPEDVPDWVGRKPPVAGDWVQTFDEEFGGVTLDGQKWNIYGVNRIPLNRAWNRNHNQNRQAHFSKDDTIVKDGNVILRYEKKTGRHNDAASGPETDYATGHLNTFGKWTQRYGYFELRLKLPQAPGLWAAFSLMPDRGKVPGDPTNRTSFGKVPTDTGVGGLEFDIVDAFSRWGRYRFNMALRTSFHADRALALRNACFRADKDGYITVGLLWTPGVAVFYSNGKEAFRWENERVSDVPSFIRYDLVTGGYGNTLVDDAQLPGDFCIDYVRVWQRKDLATPGDGPKQNSGDPDETKN